MFFNFNITPPSLLLIFSAFLWTSKKLASKLEVSSQTVFLHNCVDSMEGNYIIWYTNYSETAANFITTYIHINGLYNGLKISNVKVLKTSKCFSLIDKNLVVSVHMLLGVTVWLQVYMTATHQKDIEKPEVIKILRNQRQILPKC